MPGLQRGSVLVVEDEYLIAAAVETDLTDGGFRVVAVVNTADDAVRLACETRPDLIIMDIRLVGARDGVDAALEIFAETGIRCVFATAHADAQCKAKAVAALASGYVAQIFDFGVDEGAPFLVMELLVGETLTQRLTKGRLHPLRALKYAYDMACGLDAAHELGVVHRDVKPDNVFITFDDLLKLLDLNAFAQKFGWKEKLAPIVIQLGCATIAVTSSGR